MADFEKNCGWGCEKGDFVIGQELTVTITLNEYRSLVKSVAISDSEKSKLQVEITKLRNENTSIKQKIESLMFPDASREDGEE